MPILHRGMIVSLWLAALAGGIVPLLWVSIIQRVMTFTADDQMIDGQILGASLITLFAYVGSLVGIGGILALLAEIRLAPRRSEEHTSELQSLMRISYAVFCLKKKNAQLMHTLTL